MKKIQQVIEGLTILAKYYNDEDDDQFYLPDQETICMNATDHPMSEEDQKMMADLEWFQVDINDYRIAPEEQGYDPEAIWCFNVDY